MRGATQLKRRNADQNERRAVWAAFRAAAAKTYQIKRLYREDLLTGEVTESSRSKMNLEIGFSGDNVFKPVKSRAYALPQSLIWEELEAGAVLFTDSAKFWIENPREVPPPTKPQPKTRVCRSGACNTPDNPAEKGDLCVDCYERAKSEAFYTTGEIERFYQDVI